MEKSEQRKKEDCELLYEFMVYSMKQERVGFKDVLEQFKKDNDLLPKSSSDKIEIWINGSPVVPSTSIRFTDEPNENITFEKFGKHTYRLDWSTFDGKNVQGVKIPSLKKLQKKLNKIQKQLNDLKDGK